MNKIICLVNVFIIFLCFSCSNTYKEESYTIYAMDTIISLTFYNEANSRELIKDIENIYIKYDSVASDFSKGYGIKSVFDLNNERSITASDELIELIEFALKMKTETNGYFEPLLGRLSRAWKESLNKGKLLDDEVVENELSIIQNSNIIIKDNTVTLNGDANLDLGGIAKGYATQKAKEYLDSKSVKNYMLNAGNSNIVLGSKNGNNFKVGFKFPFDNGFYKILEISNISVGTSSMEHQYILIDGVYYSHLLNPKNGKPATNYEAISIFGHDSAILDAYSTACFAMSLEEAKDFLKEKGYEWMALSDGKIFYQSEGAFYE